MICQEDIQRARVQANDVYLYMLFSACSFVVLFRIQIRPNTPSIIIRLVALAAILIVLKHKTEICLIYFLSCPAFCVLYTGTTLEYLQF